MILQVENIEGSNSEVFVSIINTEPCWKKYDAFHHKFQYAFVMNEYIEIGLRWVFGFQMVFWGLNGFFKWFTPPSAGPKVDNFVSACIDTRFIMPTVKIMEILFGSFLLTGFMIPLSLLALAPIIFVISGLHFFNNPKPWAVIISYTIPYCLLLIIHGGLWLRLVH